MKHQLISWYHQHKRELPWRKTKNPYHIWVSEVMLQQTQVSTVIPYYQKFIERFPDIGILAHADLQDILKIWEGMGYYARARHLHQAAVEVVQKFGGCVPDHWKDFRQLPGVGDYIASAVMSIAYNQPYPVVDGNVKRVLARLHTLEYPLNQSISYHKFYQTAVRLMDHNDPGTFNQAMMELGALICKPVNPHCCLCPIASHCSAFKQHRVADYPKKIHRPAPPVHYLVIGVIIKNGKTLILKRPEKGLLGGLWEFPTLRIKPDEIPEDACMRMIQEEYHLKVSIGSKLTRIRHAYTHFKINADVFMCTFISGRVKPKRLWDFQWVLFSDLKNYPFHRSNLKFIPMVTAHNASP